jgi:hypothetical protein
LRRAHPLDEIVDAEFALSQVENDGEAQWVSQRLEKASPSLHV